jgi:hypothetical protein
MWSDVDVGGWLPMSGFRWADDGWRSCQWASWEDEADG